MKRRQGVKRIAGVLLILTLAYMTILGGGRVVAVLGQLLREEVLQQSQEIWVPGMVYANAQESLSLSEWMWEQAERLFSWKGYLDGEAVDTVWAEDLTMYELLMRQQEETTQKTMEEEDGTKATEESTRVDLSIEKLRDFQYLIRNFYTVDSTTEVYESDLDVDVLLAKDMTLQKEEEGPKILIFHTHSQEAFVDSVKGDASTSIVGMGAYLAERLNEKGIATLHHEGVYDLIDGELDRSKAYELSEVGVRKLLEQYPSIEVVIDLHRDGVNENTHLVTEINGKSTAKIMFFNGLSRTKANGEIAYLANPYIQDNLAFSLQMQLAAEELYPGFARRIYLKGYRYSLHMMPKSLLIEAGAQTNTVAEMRHAMEYLADVLSKVLLD